MEKVQVYSSDLIRDWLICSKVLTMIVGWQDNNCFAAWVVVTPIHLQPADIADLIPLVESSITIELIGSIPSNLHVLRYGSGSGLPFCTSSPVIITLNFA